MLGTGGLSPAPAFLWEGHPLTSVLSFENKCHLLGCVPWRLPEQPWHVNPTQKGLKQPPKVVSLRETHPEAQESAGEGETDRLPFPWFGDLSRGRGWWLGHRLTGPQKSRHTRL